MDFACHVRQDRIEKGQKDTLRVSNTFVPKHWTEMTSSQDPLRSYHRLVLSDICSFMLKDDKAVYLIGGEHGLRHSDKGC